MIQALRDRSIRKIGVFRALQLGDMLNAMPAMRALRYAFPDAEIVLIGLPWAESFVRRYHRWFNRWIHFPGYPGLPEQEYDAFALVTFIHEMRDEGFDLLLQMQGNGTIVNELLSCCGARLFAGFHNHECRMDPTYFVEYPDGTHEIRRHQLLMTHLGIPLAGDEIEFPITAIDIRELMALRLPLLPGRYAVLHPGSRGAWRQWPPAHFALLGDLCAEKGMELVVTGTAEERDITREVLKRLHHRAIDLTGQTSLGAMALLLRDAGVLISNCTGVSHIGAALQTPSVVISMDGEPGRWGPLNHQLHRTIDWTKHPRIDRVVMELEDLLRGRDQFRRPRVAPAEIVLVEDDASIREAIQMALAPYDVQVRGFNNGQAIMEGDLEAPRAFYARQKSAGMGWAGHLPVYQVGCEIWQGAGDHDVCRTGPGRAESWRRCR